jgi:hypothetical protein
VTEQDKVLNQLATEILFNRMKSFFEMTNQTTQQSSNSYQVYLETGSAAVGLSVGALKGLQFEDIYEIIVNPPRVVEGLEHCDPSKIGSFRLNFKLIFGFQDRGTIAQHRQLIGSEVRGDIEVFTNKTTLVMIKEALKSQFGFNAVIGKVMGCFFIFGSCYHYSIALQFCTEQGRILQRTRSLSYYHVKEYSLVTIQPKTQINKKMTTPSVYHRKRRDRPTHYQLAQIHASNAHSMRIKQEIARQNRENHCSLPVAVVTKPVATSALEEHEGSETIPLGSCPRDSSAPLRDLEDDGSDKETTDDKECPALYSRDAAGVEEVKAEVKETRVAKDGGSRDLRAAALKATTNSSNHFLSSDSGM